MKISILIFTFIMFGVQATGQKSKYTGEYDATVEKIDVSNKLYYRLYLSIDSFQIVHAIHYNDDVNVQTISGTWYVKNDTMIFQNKSGLCIHAKIYTNEQFLLTGFPDFLIAACKKLGAMKYKIYFNEYVFEPNFLMNNRQ